MNTHPQWPGFPLSEQDSPGLFTHRPQTPQRSFQGDAAGTHATSAPNRAHSGSHGETRGLLSRAQRGFVLSAKLPPKEQPEKVDARLMACVRFLRRRSPAGLRCLVCNLAVLLFFALRSVLSACARQGGYHHSRRALHVVETPDARLSKRLTRRFLALPDSSLIPAAQNIVPFLYRCQKDQRDTRWSFHFCSHLLTCPDRPDRGT